MTDINQNRSDATPLLGFRLDKAVTFAGGRRITFMADLFNVLNSNAVVNFNLSNGSSFNQINARSTRARPKSACGSSSEPRGRPVRQDRPAAALHGTFLAARLRGVPSSASAEPCRTRRQPTRWPGDRPRNLKEDVPLTRSP